MLYSFIIPVYNRPDEVAELLQSLTDQTLRNFEVIIVEDGSSIPCANVVHSFNNKLNIHYYIKSNSGPGQSRNYGVEQATGDYVLILDSDIILPPTYLQEVDKELAKQPTLAFGGPDRAHPSFSDIQKAINYSMTSFFTTGGIRGGKMRMDKFYPRSFNMGVNRSFYLQLNGFSNMRFGEDIDFSIRIYQNTDNCRLFSEAWVWHKRRTDLKKFFRQVFNSGIARINLYKKYPSSLKTVHTIPTTFTIGVFLSVLAIPFYGLGLIPLVLYAVLIFVDSTIKNHNIHIGFLSIITAYTQLLGYGVGFIWAWWKRCVLRKNEFSAFSKNFYK